MRLFLDAGEWVAGLLQVAGQQEIQTDHVARLLSQMNPLPPASQAARAMKQSAAHPVLDLLSIGDVVDQAALHGLLVRIRDLGMPILLVSRLQLASGA